MSRTSSPAEPPLRHAVYHILLALSSTDLHGLGIADEIERNSEGVLELGPATLYRTLGELAEAGLITPAEPPSEEADPRRKYYRIHPRGREVLARETARLQRLVETARSRDALPQGR